AITGYIDGSPFRAEGSASKLRHSGVDAPADRGAVGKRAWRFKKPISERLGALRPVYQHPVDDDLLAAKSRPLKKENADAAAAAGLDCLKHAGIGQRRGVALPLQLKLLTVDAARHIRCKHKKKINRLGGSYGRRTEQCAHDRQHDDCAAEELAHRT